MRVYAFDVDETLEVITWRQLALHDKPIVLVDNAGYWAPLVALIDHAIVAGFAPPATRRLFTVVATVDDIFDAVARAPEATVTAHESLL